MPCSLLALCEVALCVRLRAEPQRSDMLQNNMATPTSTTTRNGTGDERATKQTLLRLDTKRAVSVARSEVRVRLIEIVTSLALELNSVRP